MTVSLTPEQIAELDQNSGSPLILQDTKNQRGYVLVPAAAYERAKPLFDAIIAQSRSSVELPPAPKLSESAPQLPQCIRTSISTLSPYPFLVRKPIPVTIQVTDEDSVACFLEANVSATGDTPQEAFHNLCDILMAKFELFDVLEPAKLGTEPTRQLAVIREFVARVQA
jgi:hypothetical protein